MGPRQGDDAQERRKRRLLYQTALSIPKMRKVQLAWALFLTALATSARYDRRKGRRTKVTVRT